jgi:hypothetical protein
MIEIFTWVLVEKIVVVVEGSNSSSNSSILFLMASISCGLANDWSTKYPIKPSNDPIKQETNPCFSIPNIPMHTHGLLYGFTLRIEELKLFRTEVSNDSHDFLCTRNSESKS